MDTVAEPHAAGWATRSRLPTPPRRLIGRERELHRILELLRHEHVRLLTLTGLGGIGKTRLALEVASILAPDFDAGACFVDLAPCRDAVAVVSAIAAALDLRDTGRRPPLDALSAALARLQILLILDNFEQVLDAVTVASDLVAACPMLTVLATSRAPLRVSWEYELPVAPLEVPEPAAAHADAAKVLASPSVALLLDRLGESATLQPATDAPTLVEICSKLAGIPLAIELAAARGRLLPPRDLLARLDHPLDVLTIGARDLPDRHQTLRQTFAWSYGLLNETDQACFRQLSVFVAGCTPEAAATITHAAAPDALDFVDAMDRLVENSLLQRVRSDADGEARFQMLEPVREFASEMLDSVGEGDLVRETHAAYFLALVERSEPELRGPRQGEWYARVEREYGNVRAALRWFEGHGDAERALRLASALAWFWWVHGYAREGRERLARVLALPAPVSPAVTRARAKTLYGAAVLAYQEAEYDSAVQHGHAALDLYTELGDHGIGPVLNTLGNCALATSALDRAEGFYERSLNASREVDDQRGVGMALTNLGLTALLRADLPRARAMLSDGLAIERAAGDTRGIALAVGGLGLVHVYLRQFDVALEQLRESLTFWRAVGERAYLPLPLEACAVLAAAAGNHRAALTIAAGADALRQEMDAPRPPVWTPELDRWLTQSRQQLGGSTSAAVWAQGLSAGATGAVAAALALDLSPSPNATPRGLTPREVEVLRLVAGGNTNKEIATALVVSVPTVERHLANIYGKIDARGRADATAFAIGAGLAHPRTAL